MKALWHLEMRLSRCGASLLASSFETFYGLSLIAQHQWVNYQLCADVDQQKDVEEMYCRKSAVEVMPTVHKKDLQIEHRLFDPILAFAVACWAGLTLAHSYHPDYIVLESILFNLIKPLIAGNAPATSQLAVIKRLKASLKLTYHRFEEIVEESNGVSSQLAISALKTG
ncbi:hypothetical protein U9M48_029606, partial [Paspalum notatum var. saurae]